MEEILKKSQWAQKIKRTVTSILPVDQTRKGDCKRCGACCMLPNRCPFLQFEDERNRRNSICAIYDIRPFNCRKYPRSKDEHVIPSCGFYFEEK